MTKTTLTDTISYSYDANDRVTLETVTDPEDLPLYSRAYTYDSNGNTLSDETSAAGYGSQADTKTYCDVSKHHPPMISITCDLVEKSEISAKNSVFE